MAGGNKFRLILSADIDTKDLRKKIDDMGKQVLKLSVELDGSAIAKIEKKLADVQSKVSNKIKFVDVTDASQVITDLDKVKNKFEEIKAAVNDDAAKFTVKATGPDEKINTAIMEYNDKLGKSVTETYQLVKLNEDLAKQLGQSTGWVKTQTVAIDDQEKTVRVLADEAKKKAAEEKKIADEYGRMAIAAEKFLEKTRNMVGANPNIGKGQGLAQEIKQAVSDENIVKARQLSKELEVVSANLRGMKEGYNSADLVPGGDFETFLKTFEGDSKAVVDKVNDEFGNLAKATIKYDDGLGLVTKSTFELKQATDGSFGFIETKYEELDQRAKTLADTVEREEKRKVAALQKEAKEMEKMDLYADKFLSRSKDLSQNNPSVAQGISTANSLKSAIADGDVEKAKQLNRELQVLDANIKQSGNSAYSFSKEMEIALKRTMEWASAVGMVYAAIRKFQEGIQYIKDINKEMTNIQVLQVTGAKTNDEIEALAGNFNNLAKEMGATTEQIAQSSVEWLRQGKSIAETETLIKSTMMLSKLGALESAQATEYLTSTLNGFSMSADEAASVVDRLIQLDNSAATSAGEIASALQRSAAVAAQSGVTFDQLASYITVLSSTTRLSSEMIGESLGLQLY